MFTAQLPDMGDGEEQISVGRLTPGTSALFVCDMQVTAGFWAQTTFLRVSKLVF